MEIKSKENSHKTILNATGIFGFAQAMKMLVSIVGSKFVAIFLGPFGIGIVGLLNNTVAIISSLTSFGINITGVREVSMANAENDKIKFSERYIVLQRWSIFTSILGALLTIIFSKLLSELTFGTTNYYFWFVILSVNFGGAILVKFNGHIVYSMPQGSRMLEIGNPLHIQVGSEARGFFGMGSRRKILEEKPTVNIGYSEVELPSNSGLQAQICLKRFVKSGNNMLEFVVVGAGYNDFDKQGKNHFSFVLSATQKYCQQWDKSWQEECAFED